MKKEQKLTAYTNVKWQKGTCNPYLHETTLNSPVKIMNTNKIAKIFLKISNTIYDWAVSFSELLSGVTITDN